MGAPVGLETAGAAEGAGGEGGVGAADAAEGGGGGVPGGRGGGGEGGAGAGRCGAVAVVGAAEGGDGGEGAGWWRGGWGPGEVLPAGAARVAGGAAGDFHVHALVGGGRVELDVAGRDGLDGLGHFGEGPFALLLLLPFPVPGGRVMGAVSEVGWCDWSGDGEGADGLSLPAKRGSGVGQVGGRGSGVGVFPFASPAGR